MENTEIRRRQSVLESERTNIETEWDKITRYVVPYRGDFQSTVAEQEEAVEWDESRRLFDSTAVMAATILAASLHGSMTSSAFRWFDMEFRQKELNDDQELKIWIEQVAEIVYNALQDSNFNLEVAEAYLDLVTMGTAALVEELDGTEFSEDSQLVFSAVPIKQVFFDEDFYGRVARFYRVLEWTPLQMVTKFGDNVPDCIKEAIENETHATATQKVIFAIWKRDEMEEVKPDSGGILPPDKRPYVGRYILKRTAEQLGEDIGYYEMPVFCPRWRKTTDSKWGNSPAMIAMPDILTVNQLVELILRAAEKVVDPATLTTERGLISDLDLEPGGLTVVRTLDEISQFESRARFDVSELQRDKLRDSINRIFMVDQLELKQSPAMSATEVQVRYELMQRLLGPTSGRIQSDLHDPLIERTTRMMARAGKLPPLPQGRNLDDIVMNVVYKGPLSRSQKLDIAAATERFLATIAGITEVKPEVLDNIDFDAITRDMASALNLPATVIKPTTKVAADRRKRQEQEAQMAQAEAMAQAGQGLQGMGQGLKAVKDAANG